MRYAPVWLFICSIALASILVLPDPHTEALTSTPSIASVSVTPGPTETPSTIVWGDASCDRLIDARDVVDVLRRVSNTAEDPQPCGPIFKSLGESSTTFSIDPALSYLVVGDGVSVYLALSTQTELYSWRIAVHYDPTVLTTTGCSSGSPCNLGSDVVMFEGRGASGELRLGAISFTSAGASGDSSLLEIEVLEAIDDDEQAVDNATVDGEVILVAETPTPSPTLSPVPTPTGFTPQPTAAPFWYRADIDCDTKISTKDAFHLIEYLAFGFARSAVSPPCPVVGTETPAT